MKQQRGGTILGFIIGVVVGLAVALAVAVYVTKVPVPFMNKGQTRSADQDVEEAKKNKDWDPNAPLYGKNPAKPPQSVVSGPVTAVAPAPAPVAPVPAKPDAKQEVKPEAKAADSKAPDSKPSDTKPADARKAAASGDPLGDLAKAKAAAADTEPFVYWVQVGAYRSAEDAESQRAKLSLSGIETKISEREQSGRTVYRVRVGPFDKKEEGEKTKEKLDKSGLESALVRVQR
jgi:cell division protein FtsN